MPDNEQKGKPGTSQGNNYIKYTGIGFQMLAIIGVFTYAGHKIDQSAHHTKQWATAALALAGVFIALFVVIRSVRNM